MPEDNDVPPMRERRFGAKWSTKAHPVTGEEMIVSEVLGADVAGTFGTGRPKVEVFRKVLKVGSDSVTSNDMERDQVSDMIGASEARSETKLEKAMGEVREEFAKISGRFDTVNAKLDDLRVGQRNSFWSLAGIIVATIAIVVAVVSYGGAMFGTGLTTSQIASQAATQAVTQALAAQKKP